MGAVEIVVWGLEPQKDLRAMLVSLVLCQRLPASFLGWVLSVGPTPGYFMDGCSHSIWSHLSLPGPLCLYLNGLTQDMVVQKPPPWLGSSESLEAKTLECQFSLSSEPSTLDCFPTCTPENRFSALEVRHVDAAAASPRSWLEVQVQVPCTVPLCPRGENCSSPAIFKLAKS